MPAIHSRRSLLRLSCRSASLLGATAAMSRLGRFNLFAQSVSDYRALVCIFLFGGNDSNNMIVPLASSAYGSFSRARGPLSISASSLLSVSAGGSSLGLHPALRDIRQIYNEGNATAVLNVGNLVRPVTRAQYRANSTPVPGNLFSHSDQQQQWQTGVPNAAGRTGWAGRAADTMRAANSPSVFPLAVSVAGNSTFCNGAETQPGTVIPGTSLALDQSDGSPGADARDRAFEQLLEFDTGFSLIQSANRATTSGLEISRLLNGALEGSPRLSTTFPSTGLGDQLEQVANLIKVRSDLRMKRQIFFCSLGGFDTHSNQLETQHALLAELNGAVAAFYRATQELNVSNSVVTFTESEFGRTMQPSSRGGSDHAWGSHHLVVGGAVRGGNVYGGFPEFGLNGPDDATDRGIWIPKLALDQYGATLARWFGVSTSSLSAVFPNLANFSSSNLGFLS